MNTTTISATQGTVTSEITLEGNVTAGDLFGNPMVAAIFNASDKFVVIRNGAELPADAPLKEGDEVELVNQAGTKG